MGGQELVYEVAPADFETLPDARKLEALRRFLSLMRTLTRRARIVMAVEPLSVDIGGERAELSQTRTYLHSPAGLEDGLEGLDYRLVSRPPGPGAARERPSLLGRPRLELAGGGVCTCLTLYELPARLRPAWASSLAARADSVSVRVAPVPHGRAVSGLRRYSSVLAASPDRSPGRAYRAAKAAAALEALERQETSLFELECVAAVRAPDAAALRGRVRAFLAHAAASMTRWDATPGRQAAMLEEGRGKRLYVDLGSLSAFYPFSSSDLVETPGGICLGVNTATGAPVVWDHSSLDSYNVLVLARTGKGKSVAAKTMLTRLLEKHPDAMVFVIDPKGEYPPAKWGLELVDASAGRLGLDPLRLFPGRADAAEVVSDICGVGEEDAPVRNEILAAAERSSSAAELCAALDPAGPAMGYARRLLAEDMRRATSGGRELGERAVISLRGAPEAAATALTVLAFARAWKAIRDADPRRPKVVVVDEGWRLFRRRSTSRIVEELARLGRAHHAIGIFITQEPRDITSSEHGRAFANSAGLKVVLGLEPDAARAARDALDLSDREAEMLPSFSRGQALLLTKGYRIRARIRPSREELRLFDTDPTGRGSA